MVKSLTFYILGGILSLILLFYAISSLSFLVSQIGVISKSELLPAPEITSFHLEKFQELKISQ